jgi:hypothetical protein
MPVDERTRRLMSAELVRVHGEEVADALMAHLPPVGWADVATKHDLAALAQQLRGEMSELRGEMSELRGELSGLRGEVTGGIAELRGEMAELGGALRTEMAAQTRVILFAFLTAVLASTSLAFAAARFAG